MHTRIVLLRLRTTTIMLRNPIGKTIHQDIDHPTLVRLQHIDIRTMRIRPSLDPLLLTKAPCHRHSLEISPILNHQCRCRSIIPNRTTPRRKHGCSLTSNLPCKPHSSRRRHRSLSLRSSNSMMHGGIPTHIPTDILPHKHHSTDRNHIKMAHTLHMAHRYGIKADLQTGIVMAMMMNTALGMEDVGALEDIEVVGDEVALYRGYLDRLSSDVNK